MLNTLAMATLGGASYHMGERGGPLFSHPLWLLALWFAACALHGGTDAWGRK
jgi:hypothetical protein